MTAAALSVAQANPKSALRLANEKAQALYKCRPYTNGPAAQLVRGNYWVWHGRRGQGQVDFEATVKFATNGSDASVSVDLLDSRGMVERGF